MYVLPFLVSLLCIHAAHGLPKAKYSGMTFTGDKYCPNVTFSSTSASESLEHIHTTGANSVSIVVTQYQKYHNSTEIFPLYTPVYSSYYTYITAKDAEFESAIMHAHSLGMTVMFKLQIDLTEDDAFWRGQIGEGFTDTQWQAWFASYGATLKRYVAICQHLKVEIVSVSCELVEASTQDKYWRALIKDIRQMYNGTLTDAANWGWLNAKGGEETNKTWWDAVDIIGVDAYYLNFLMSNISNPTMDQIMAQWIPVVTRFQNLTKTFNRPLMLTEIGYCPGTECTRDHTPTAAELAYQAMFYTACFETFLPYDWFLGVFWWNWATDNSFGGPANDCMSPSFKPAEDVLRQYYQATLPKPSVPTAPPKCLCTL
eukprot:TRINITY_DN5319_c0_g1_i1.p1 TRINITY_DN5319_c0_g1~~TRINITY_DN5319_c0_g1_i1.p1  ORF type:complete len:371 (+),score=67.03 TRINITY_DN5319_c0_g1_i1:27-1139(+)